MKKIFFLLIFSIIFTSCSNPNIAPNPDSLENLIIGNIDESCREDFLNFYETQSQYKGYDFEADYLDVFRTNNTCILGYYYAHEARHYWSVIELNHNYTELHRSECLPKYDVENDTFEYCDSEALSKAQMEYQAFIADYK